MDNIVDLTIDEKLSDDDNYNNTPNRRRYHRDWDDNIDDINIDGYPIQHKRRRYNNNYIDNNNNNSNNNQQTQYEYNDNHNIKNRDNSQNDRHFTNKKTLNVSNVPYSVKAHELMYHLNQERLCLNGVLRVQLISKSPNRHNGKGRILFSSREITHDVLNHEKPKPNMSRIDIMYHNHSIKKMFTIKGRKLKFSRWKRWKCQHDDEEEKEDDEHDEIFNLGPASFIFGDKSYPYLINQTHEESLDFVVFDFNNRDRCIRAKKQFDISYISQFMGTTPKAIEYRISFKDILNKINYYERDNMMEINMCHPLRKYKIFPDSQYENFDTEKSLCERFERSLCDSKFAQNMTVIIKFVHQSSISEDCSKLLKKYNLLETPSINIPFSLRISSSIDIISNQYTISNPPDWIYKLPENIQYLLMCLHTKQPSTLSFSSMTNDNKFVPLLIKYNEKSNKMLCNALEHIHSSDAYIAEPAQALEYYISQKFNPNHSGDIEPGFGYIRHSWISLSGIRLLPPYLETTNRVVRWYPDLTDHFIRVTFCEDNGNRLYHQDALIEETRVYLKNILKNGILIGQRKYEFLAFGSSQLNEQSVWMYYDDGISNVSADTIRAKMGNFNHIKSVAKYAARMGQCFSTTVDSIKTNDVQKIQDITRPFVEEKYMDDIFEVVRIPNELIASKQPTEICFSDGIGRISPEFATKVSLSLGLLRRPSAFQIRYGGCKGMVAIHPECKHDLELRDSMHKFDSTHNMFEVCRYSFCSPAYLNRQIITLFETVNDAPSTTNTLVEIGKKCIKELTNMRMDRNVAISQLSHRSFGDNPLSPIYVLMKLLQHKFPMNHPFIRSAIEIFVRSELKNIQNRHRILIENGTSILGVMDECNILKANEVFILIKSPLINKNAEVRISGDIVITKCPTLAPGDLRKFYANSSDEVYETLKHLKNVVVFSQKGIISPTMQMSGSDLDGDIYWCCWQRNIVNIMIYNEKPLYFPSPKPKIVDNVSIDDLQEFFLDYMKMDCLGMLAHSHLAVADKSIDGAKDKKCLLLSVLNSYAVDYRKSGTAVDIQKFKNWYGSNYRESLLPKQFPYFMRKYNSSYQSQKALGKIYRNCSNAINSVDQHYKYNIGIIKCEHNNFDELMIIDGYKKYENNARNILYNYSDDILSIKNRWEIKREIELFMNRPLSNIKLPNLKDFDIKQKIKYQMNGLKKKYRAIFFDEFNNDNNTNKNKNVMIRKKRFNIEMKRKASAWYLVTMNTESIDTPTTSLTFPFVIFDVLCSILS